MQVTRTARVNPTTAALVALALFTALIGIRALTGDLPVDTLPSVGRDLVALSASVLIESLPFIFLGLLLSVIVQVWVPAWVFDRVLPRNPWLRRAALSLLGILLPVCECGNVPLSRGLIMRGLSVPEACARMFTNIPLQEVNFFSIVIAIQSQAGGNLSEALGNLSRVLRERRKMRAKVNALSMEAKASAAIIGALPFIVAFLVYLTSPDYIMILFQDPRGHLILGISGFWMSIGILVMRNMINFDI